MANSGVNEVKKVAKREFFSDLQEMLLEAGYEIKDGADYGIKGTSLIIRQVATGRGACDLKLVITAPAKGTEY